MLLVRDKRYPRDSIPNYPKFCLYGFKGYSVKIQFDRAYLQGPIRDAISLLFWLCSLGILMDGIFMCR